MLEIPFNNFRRLKQHASRFMPILHLNFENVSKKEKYSVVNKESYLHITNSIYSLPTLPKKAKIDNNSHCVSHAVEIW
jgi:hypothetical protein